jgi:dihydrofolate reductase
MSAVFEEEVAVVLKPISQKSFYRVYLRFRKPEGGVSVFGGCNVYQSLGNIFNKLPEEIYLSVCKLVYENGDGFMQEYLTAEDASKAVAEASLFAHVARCVCFLKQSASFYIEECKK